MALEIVYVGTLPPHQGGSAVLCSQLLEGLSKRGDSIRAVSPIPAAAAGLADPFAVANPQIEVERFPLPYLEIDTYRSPGEDYRLNEHRHIDQRLAKLVEARAPDILLVGRETFFWHVPDLVGAFRIPTVVICHCGSLHQGIQDGHHNSYSVRQLFGNLRRADRLVSPSEWMASHLDRRGLDSTVIPNLINTELFSPRQRDVDLLDSLEIERGAKVVLHLSNLKSVKRPFDLVKAAELVLKDVSNAVFLIAGDGPCRVEMQEMCLTKGILGSFRFPGWVGYEQVPDYLSIADVVTLPSEIEVQPLSCLEAQACERAVLVSDIPACREIVSDGETGILFRKGDVTNLADRITALVRDPQLCRALGRRAREKVITIHSEENVLKRYRTLLCEVVRSREIGKAH